ncbi:hypothetical protein ACEWY4_027865 [Coilia grayii]|uniref:F-box domain-containing protein n=1 Tax=Coilia grayii TaxID=363190 RepID=A0ABD1INF4_9TELE
MRLCLGSECLSSSSPSPCSGGVSLLSLPWEMVTRIASHLPAQCIVNVLPQVCPVLGGVGEDPLVWQQRAQRLVGGALFPAGPREQLDWAAACMEMEQLLALWGPWSSAGGRGGETGPAHKQEAGGRRRQEQRGRGQGQRGRGPGAGGGGGSGSRGGGGAWSRGGGGRSRGEEPGAEGEEAGAEGEGPGAEGEEAGAEGEEPGAEGERQGAEGEEAGAGGQGQPGAEVERAGERRQQEAQRGEGDDEQRGERGGKRRRRGKGVRIREERRRERGGEARGRGEARGTRGCGGRTAGGAGPAAAQAGGASAHRGWVWCLAEGGGRLASGAFDSTVRLWDLGAGGAPSAVITGRAPVICLSWQHHALIAGSHDRKISFYDPRAPEPLVKSLQLHSSVVLSLVANENYIISGSKDNTVALYDQRACKLLNKLTLGAFLLCMSLSGQEVWGGDNRGSVHTFSLQDGRLHTLHHLNVGHTHLLTGIHYSPGSLYTCSSDRTIKVHSLAAPPRTVCTLRNATPVNGLSVEAGVLAVASGNMAVEVWRPPQ